MDRGLSLHWKALSQLAINLSIGLVPFGLLVFHPAFAIRDVIPVWYCLAFSLGAAAALSLAARASGEIIPPIRVAGLRHVLSCLLLGSSLAAIPWKSRELPLATGVILTGFAIRWLLYALETRDLRKADRGKLPLPCLATRIRRAITFITGALIPALVLAGLPAVPLLCLSFVLTAFAQWTVVFEGTAFLGQERIRVLLPENSS